MDCRFQKWILGFSAMTCFSYWVDNHSNCNSSFFIVDFFEVNLLFSLGTDASTIYHLQICMVVIQNFDRHLHIDLKSFWNYHANIWCFFGLSDSTPNTISIIWPNQYCCGFWECYSKPPLCFLLMDVVWSPTKRYSIGGNEMIWN